MSVDDRLGVFLNTGILASRAHNLGSLIEQQSALMRQFMEARFEPAACAGLLCDAIARDPSLEELFDPSSVAAGGCIASRSLLYDLHRRRDRWALVVAPPCGEPAVLDVAAADVLQLASALREALQRNHWQPLFGMFPDLRLLQCQRPAADTVLAWPAFDGPGIQRLEHASLLFASETTRLLADPISLAIGGNVGLSDLDRAPSNLGIGVDGMLVTHGHLDHWHIPTILRHGGDGSIPVVVPRIPVPSLLAQDDMQQSLRDVGQRALAPNWGETVQIGDIEIDILPFYGEQPTNGMAVPPDGVRNWGNCYRVTTPQLSAILLVDSGEDASGSVMDVIDRSVARRGRPDLILSCCRELRGAPFFQGLFTFWMVLTMTDLQRLLQITGSGNGPSITLGPSGIGDVCVRAGARAFAPYANGFRGIGAEIDDIGWTNGEPAEAEVLDQIDARIGALGGTTTVVRWLPGNVLRPGPGGTWQVS